MTKRILPQSRPEIKELEPNEVLRALSQYYRKPTRALIYTLYDLNYTYADIAKILKISPQRVQKVYPKKEVHE